MEITNQATNVLYLVNRIYSEAHLIQLWVVVLAITSGKGKKQQESC